MKGCLQKQKSTTGSLRGEQDLFAYSFLPSPFIFASIGEMQPSFSMEHAIFHFSNISGMSGDCEFTRPLHPLKDNMRGNEMLCSIFFFTKAKYF